MRDEEEVEEGDVVARQDELPEVEAALRRDFGLDLGGVDMGGEWGRSGVWL